MGRYYPTCSKCSESNDSASGNWCKQCWRDYHAEHKKDRNAQRHQKYWQDPEAARAARMAWAKANPEKTRASQRKDRERHREAHKIYLRAYYQENKPRFKTYYKRYYAENKLKFALYSHNRKTLLKRLQKESDWKITVEWWEVLLTKYENLCAYCGKPSAEGARLTIEHVTPLSRGGAHRPQNIVPACATCNASKQSKTPEEFGKHPRLP